MKKKHGKWLHFPKYSIYYKCCILTVDFKVYCFISVFLFVLCTFKISVIKVFNGTFKVSVFCKYT